MSNLSWEAFKTQCYVDPQTHFLVDYSCVFWGQDFQDRTLPALLKPALEAMQALEAGALANVDEQRPVGHYWLRSPNLAPDATYTQAIEHSWEAIKTFSERIHCRMIQGGQGPFIHLLCIGIGGSALGPQLLADALGEAARDKLKPHFIDNTDPDGIRRTLQLLDKELGQTLVLVTSKSGGTPEPRNAMLEVEACFAAKGLRFADHAVAVTTPGSLLDTYASAQGFLARFPMWDWVGGRTSVLSPVGLLPAALQGLAIEDLLAGACHMDTLTRCGDWRQNPAALLSGIWFFETGGKGQKAMVLLPYKDRLALLPKYLQQLVMESLGKEKDLQGRVVHQGLTVYGNKGSTDQHAYVQQLRDGLPNFFATFIQVLKPLAGSTGTPVQVEPGVTSADYLSAFLMGTQEALAERKRGSVLLMLPELNAFYLGMLIALYERAVGFYASFIGVNAYHQPGVEAGKKAASATLALRARVLAFLHAHPGQMWTALALAGGLGEESSAAACFKILLHLAAQPHTAVRMQVNTHDYTDSEFGYYTVKG
jgi:glucose-6-phosphate isomerase